MRRIALLPVVALLLAADEPKKDVVETDDESALMGTWKVVKAVRAGKELAATERDQLKFEFKGKRIIVHDNGRDEPAEFTIGTSKAPKSIDIKPQRGGANTVYGIFEVSGDALKLCFTRQGGERPKQFISTAGSEVMLLILQREKK